MPVFESIIGLEVAMDITLTWEDSYAIARALARQYPQVDLEEVSLGMIYQWTIALSGFSDDVDLANDSILSDIYREWFEEVNSIWAK